MKLFNLLTKLIRKTNRDYRTTWNNVPSYRTTWNEIPDYRIKQK